MTLLRHANYNTQNKSNEVIELVSLFILSSNDSFVLNNDKLIELQIGTLIYILSFTLSQITRHYHRRLSMPLSIPYYNITYA